MISIETADRILAENLLDFGLEEISLTTALRRVLREVVRADRDFPPFHRATMDGIALRQEAWAQGRRQFPILGMALAGAPQQALPHPAACLEIMTGAMLPNGADTVVRYEDLLLENGSATIQAAEVRPQQNVHFQGLDCRRGDLLLSPGATLAAGHLSALATVGQAQVAVSRLPRVAILSTGDELVSVEATPLPHQIRASNLYAIQALLQPLGIEPDFFFSKDEKVDLRKMAKKILGRYGVLICTGGISAGRTDWVAESLVVAGLTCHFHKVAQRPGKPLWFGTMAGEVAAFGLPGNPISAFVCTLRYVLPWLRQCLRAAPTPPDWAILAEPVTFRPDLTYFLPVNLKNERGQILATPLPGHGSGDLVTLNAADAFLELPQERAVFAVGEAFPALRF